MKSFVFKNLLFVSLYSITTFPHAIIFPNASGKLIDQGNLDWQVANYTESHLQNSDQSDSSGFNASFSPNGKDKNGNNTYGSTTLGAHRQGHDRQGQTLATIGKTQQGKQVGANQHLNRSQRITKDHQTGGLDASATLDHRLLNKAGRKLIKKDFDILAKGTGIKESLEKHGNVNNKNVFANGVLNDLDDAQKSAIGITGEENPQIWYNPSYGILYDLIESALDYTGIGSANSHRADQWMKQNKNLKIHAHSQGTLIIEKGAMNNRHNGHTINTYGNPWRPFANSTEDIKKRFGWTGKGDETVMDPHRHDGDFVSKPLNSLIPKNWSELGHSMEDYIKSKNKKKLENK